ncbi:MAG TPA: glutamine synthetase family protein [Armatimonadota bacterium]|nr:glutamine synthetase family protein [Armatimonadota bacterium]
MDIREASHLEDTLSRAERFFDAHDVEIVRLEWCDLHGVSRGKHVSRGHFLTALETGATFSSAALQMDLQGEAYLLPGESASPSWASLIGRPDPETLQPSFIEPRAARCLVDLYTADGRPEPASPRYALQRVVEEGRSMGLEASIGIELEFYLLRFSDGAIGSGMDGSLPADRQVYRMQSSAEERGFLDALHRQMSAAGVGVEAYCAEDGPGQFEIILQHGPAVAMADAAFTARNLIKEQAARQGLLATFLSRPLASYSGSGAHVHQSLRTLSGEPVIPSEEQRDQSPFWRYLDGQLAAFKDASAFYLPTINAYKRIALRPPAPIRIDWAYEDRSAAIRLLRGANGSLRLENRAIAGEANPYLSVAASLAAGLEGVRNPAPLPDFSKRLHFGPDQPMSPTGEPIPASLSAALDHLSASAVMRRWLGPQLVDLFLMLKRAEVRRYETAITDWELREYLNLL